MLNKYIFLTITFFSLIVACGKKAEEDEFKLANYEQAENSALQVPKTAEVITNNQTPNVDDFFKTPEYAETAEGEKCIDSTNDNLEGLINCMNQEGYKIQAQIIEKAKVLNKTDVYNKKWLEINIRKFEEECEQEQADNSDDQGQKAELYIMKCVVTKLYTLGRNLE